MNKKVLFLIIIGLVIVALVVFYFGQKYDWFRKTILLEPIVRRESETLGGQVYNKIQNPGARVPETNPFQSIVNPFKGLKLNPFD